MIFTIEALQAGHGDCLILHYGNSAAPKFIVVDGGPAGIYRKALQPRLERIRRRWARDGVIDLEMVMVSHIDDDHIRGIIELLQDCAASYRIGTLWHNSFDTQSEPLRSRPSLVSLKQGRDLRALARRRGIPLNRGFDGLVASAPGALQLGDGLTFRVLSPDLERLARLRKLSRAQVTAFADRSAANIASIVVLAEADGKRILLTGDARGDHIMAGLEGAGIRHVDVFKIPHHGSTRSSAPGLYHKVTADHYIICTDGEPSRDMLDWIAAAPQSVHVTGQAGVRIDLCEPIDY